MVSVGGTIEARDAYTASQLAAHQQNFWAQKDFLHEKAQANKQALTRNFQTLRVDLAQATARMETA